MQFAENDKNDRCKEIKGPCDSMSHPLNTNL